MNLILQDRDAWVDSFLVTADKQNRWVVVKDVLCAIAMMHVKVVYHDLGNIAVFFAELSAAESPC